MVLVLGNWRFVLLLVIFSGFWGMINVLFGFMPLFVEGFSNLAAVEAAIDRIVPVTPGPATGSTPRSSSPSTPSSSSCCRRR